MSNEWNWHVNSLQSRLNDLQSTIDSIKSCVERRPGLDAATQTIAALIETSTQSEGALPEFPTALSRILSDPEIGAMLLGPQGDIVLYNTRAEALLGREYVQARNLQTGGSMPFSDATRSRRLAADELPWSRALRGEAMPDMRMHINVAGRGDTWINVSATPFRNTQGTITGAVIFLVDTSEEVQLENSIASLCNTIQDQIAVVGDTHTQLRDLADKLSRTGVQRILADSGPLPSSRPEEDPNRKKSQPRRDEGLTSSATRNDERTPAAETPESDDSASRLAPLPTSEVEAKVEESPLPSMPHTPSTAQLHFPEGTVVHADPLEEISARLLQESEALEQARAEVEGVSSLEESGADTMEQPEEETSGSDWQAFEVESTQLENQQADATPVVETSEGGSEWEEGKADQNVDTTGERRGTVYEVADDIRPVTGLAGTDLPGAKDKAGKDARGDFWLGGYDRTTTPSRAEGPIKPTAGDEVVDSAKSLFGKFANLTRETEGGVRDENEPDPALPWPELVDGQNYGEPLWEEYTHSEEEATPWQRDAIEDGADETQQPDARVTSSQEPVSESKAAAQNGEGPEPVQSVHVEESVAPASLMEAGLDAAIPQELPDSAEIAALTRAYREAPGSDVVDFAGIDDEMADAGYSDADAGPIGFESTDSAAYQSAVQSEASAQYLEPSVGYEERAGEYQEPSVGYEEPASEYEEPSVGYEDPASEQPSVGYADPATDYEEPSVGYEEPASEEPSVGYEEPAQEEPASLQDKQPASDYGFANDAETVSDYQAEAYEEQEVYDGEISELETEATSPDNLMAAPLESEPSVDVEETLIEETIVEHEQVQAPLHQTVGAELPGKAETSSVADQFAPLEKSKDIAGDKSSKRRASTSYTRQASIGAGDMESSEDGFESQVVDYSADAPSALAEGPKRVLVVDDIPVNQKLLLLHLKRLGYEADVASNGQEALDMIAKEQYELILMDCDMPVMSGFEAAGRIRSNEAYSHHRIPIIALTSYDREGDKEKCIASGMDDYITKGASQKELKETIERSIVSAKMKSQTGGAPESSSGDVEADLAPLDISAMLKLYGREEVEEISRLFLSNMGTYIECMQLAIDEKNSDSVIHFANAVKGPCSALGMRLMTRLTSDIMGFAEAQDWTQVRVKYMRLKAVFVQTREELKKVCPDDSLLTT